MDGPSATTSGEVSLHEWPISSLRPLASGSCLSCRRRKVTCKGQPPKCKACRISKLDCEWHDSRSSIVWLPTNVSGLGKNNSSQIAGLYENAVDGSAKGTGASSRLGSRRQVVYSLSERDAMCRSLTQEFSFHSLDLTLERLESKARLLTEADCEARLGPFSVFGILEKESLEVVSLEKAYPDPSIILDVEEDTGNRLVFQLTREQSLPEEQDFDHQDDIQDLSPAMTGPDMIHHEPRQGISEHLLDSVHQALREAEQAATPNDRSDDPHSETAPDNVEERLVHNHADAHENSNSAAVRCLSNIESGGMIHTHMTPGSPRPRSSVSELSFSSLASPGINDTSLTEPSTLPWPVQILSYARDEMILLVEHYRNRFLQHFSPSGNHKSPWRILHLPCVLETMSSLMTSGESSYARLSIFYGALAISAFNIDASQAITSTDHSHWKSTGELYRQKAKRNLQLALRAEVHPPKRAKYKEILMALLGMVTICAVSGQFSGARTYLSDAARFIHIRGNDKPKQSKKCIMLHNIFYYLRVVEESTFVAYQDIHSCVRNKASMTTGNVSPLAESSFKLIDDQLKWDTDDMANLPDNVKHHNLCGKSDVFEQIYGIPSSLFSLISRVSAAQKEMEMGHTDGNERLKDFAKVVRRLEHDICQWQNPFDVKDDNSSTAGARPKSGNELVMLHLVAAMHTALVVLFYRRVLNIHAWALQHHVRSAIKDLLEYESTKLEYNITSTGIVWPAFVVACEAIAAKDRDQIASWLLRSAQQSGIRSFEVAREVAMKLWSANEEGTPGDNIHWDLPGDQFQLTLVFT